MSLFIKQARELYNSTFSTANLKKYSNEDINIQLEGSARIDEYYKSVFILLSKAVLSGEYIFDPNYSRYCYGNRQYRHLFYTTVFRSKFGAQMYPKTLCRVSN